MSQNIHQHQLINLAQQGDATSLTILINQNLFPLGVTVMTTRQDNCLVVTAVLPQDVDRLFLINFMREGMERLQAQSIQRILLIGKDREKIAPDWQYTLNLHQADLPPLPSFRSRQVSAMPSASSTPQSHPQSAPLHPLTSKPVRLLLLIATCALLAGGTWAARKVFLVESASENYNLPAPSDRLLP